MQFIDCAQEDWRSALEDRGPKRDLDLESIVSIIIADVQERGDEALLEIARRFDSPHLVSIKTDLAEIEESSIKPEQEEALTAAFARILNFHERQVQVFTSAMEKSGSDWTWKMPGSEVGQRVRPLKSAGLYVPGGRASYPSSVLMLAGPAAAARVQSIVVTTPSMRNGMLPLSVLFALKIANVKSVFKIGGASAVAALAFGTESVPKVEKVAGPGNRYVNEAKRQLWGSVGVDGQYGPSEVCVVIDSSSNLDFAAADLLTQIEHAPDNLGFVVSVGSVPLDGISEIIDHQAAAAPRAEIFRACLENVKAFCARDVAEAAEIVNRIAPEHLTLSVQDPSRLFDLIENAGCILLGEWTPESVADYCLGPSHTLPTNAAARFASPLNAFDFLKIQSFGNLTQPELLPLVDTVSAIAEAEGFPAHGYGTVVRKT